MSYEFFSYTFGKLIEDFRRLIQAGVGGVVNEIIEKKFIEIEEIKMRLAEIERILSMTNVSPSKETEQESKSEEKLVDEITKEVDEITKGKNICKVDGCTKPHLARGYCKNHYYMMKRQGFLGNLKDGNTLKRCEVEGCEKFVESRGLCKNHYAQFRRGTLVLVDGKYIKKT